MLQAWAAWLLQSAAVADQEAPCLSVCPGGRSFLRLSCSVLSDPFLFAIALLYSESLSQNSHLLLYPINHHLVILQ